MSVLKSSVLISLSIFMPVPCCFYLQYNLKSGMVMCSALFLFRIVLAILDLLCFHIKILNYFSISSKINIGTLMGVSLNL